MVSRNLSVNWLLTVGLIYVGFLLTIIEISWSPLLHPTKFYVIIIFFPYIGLFSSTEIAFKLEEITIVPICAFGVVPDFIS